MKLTFITLEVFGGAKKGGGERYVTELTRAIRAKGFTVNVLVVRSMGKIYELREVDKPVKRITFQDLVSTIRSSDIVHVHQLNTPGFDYAALLTKLFRKPLILTDHGGGRLHPVDCLGEPDLG
ncbi:glycosyltransferase [Sphingomonas sp. 22L2VL55-3]